MLITRRRQFVDAGLPSLRRPSSLDEIQPVVLMLWGRPG